jgi:putative tryptophan/tyrosine transport system substrate-binding protein
MRRREFIGLVGGAATASLLRPLAMQAQPLRKPRRIAFVHSGIPANQLTESTGPFWVRRFHETLRGLGDIEGANLAVERYSAEGRSDRFAALAAEVVGHNPDVIITNLNDLTKAFTTATSTIPIVAITGDPLAAGLITSLAHPGGNLTGVSVDAGVAIVAKRMQILKEALPRAARASYLLSNAWDDRTESSYREAAQRMGIALTENFLAEINDAELRRTFAVMAQQQFDAALVDEGGSFVAHRALIAELAEKHRLPVIYPYRDYVDLGGLITYAPDLGELAQRLANDVHQILGGTKPGDIPYYQPTKFLLIINLKAARALGLDLPATLVLRADEVIE